MHASDIFTATLGGVLIGAAASGLLLFNGRIAGVSNILAGVLSPRRGDTLWRLCFVLGLLSGGALLLLAYPVVFDVSHPRSLPVLAAAGLLVGLGTRISNGCTSGHGVCGLSRRSVRSLAATVTFMVTGALTVYLVGHVFGGTVR